MLLNTMANLIQVRQGSTPVPAAAWKRVTVLGGGAPVWEKLATLGIPQDRKPKVAVLCKADATGLKGSRFVATGDMVINLPATSIFKEASHEAYK